MKIELEKLTLGAQIIFKELHERGYYIEVLDRHENIILISKNHKKIFSRGSYSFPINSKVSSYVSTNKFLTNLLLRKNNIPTTNQKKCKNIEEIKRFATANQYPFVIKPFNLAHGTGVITYIINKKDLLEIADKSLKKYKEILIETQVMGEDYRLLIVDGKCVSAVKRIPARVIGDGKNTIKKLINIENKNPLRGKQYTKPLVYITIDNETKNILRKNKWKLTSIPQKGQIIVLKEGCNQGKGGEIENVTDKIHSTNKKIAELAAKTIFLPYAGVDIISSDISKPIVVNNGVILEINSEPGIYIHQYPSKGKGDNVGKAIADMIEKYCFK